MGNTPSIEMWAAGRAVSGGLIGQFLAARSTQRRDPAGPSSGGGQGAGRRGSGPAAGSPSHRRSGRTS